MTEFILRSAGPFTYEVDVSNDRRMRVPGIIYSSDKLMKQISHDQSIQQVINVAMLPGIVRASYAMPDIHWGYGFPIGGVAAFDAVEGIVSPGGVGYDINCGVSLVRTNVSVEDVKSRIKELINLLFSTVPSGIGSTKLRLNDTQMEDILLNGSRWALENGYAEPSDLSSTEEGGKLADANPAKVSPEAKKRGAKQVGTLGAGNHFLEVQMVENILDPEIASNFGISEVGMTTVMVHTGSRGLGHQVATDYIRAINNSNEGVVEHPVDRQLNSLKIDSRLGQDYLQAMNAAANFGFVNRQIIVKGIMDSFDRIFPGSKVELVYSLAHNIAKREYHYVDGSKRELIIHRKGATRAFAPSSMPDNDKFSKYGHPVLIPGDMGSASYILVGREGNEEKSFGSSCHGAGRKLSRKKSLEEFDSEMVISSLASKGIYLRAQNRNVVSEEAPGSYKDIDEVVDAVRGAGLTTPIARMIPIGVVKG
jgi:tRNA-splicing ligase RtcB